MQEEGANMVKRNYHQEREDYGRLLSSAPKRFDRLMSDLNLGQLNIDVIADATNADDETRWLIQVSSTYYMLGHYDQEDLESTYHALGVGRSQKWAAKVARYIDLRR